MKKNILVGVCAGISSYKTCELVRLLVKNNFSVKVIMTENSTKFVTPLVFQSLTQCPVYLDTFGLSDCGSIKHISLAKWAHACVIAPLSANSLSKIAQGLCDNLLTTVVCALPKNTKVLLIPAMNENMWNNPIVGENIRKLEKIKKYIILPPQKGELACGDSGQGRMPQPGEIYTTLKSITK
ncbi:MAG: hypothetical protein KKC11_06600 [Candidatus Omnitrophica bacterium]|nr:hypothetical protein [Candidatus Omnitrophota bacterium]MBU0878288.1 hypothetical protein [Candidatus Omnitrophota bacterium]MBU1133480.1 hypothetical protein [Candidatus Omnitrophota bacterium]MBU1367245.1 hypothetical protein [Candidatus Omnitrophota bacterium]MBU1523834.1 hypothetical protein [Candidatus Omnitrophota bacterium]